MCRITLKMQFIILCFFLIVESHDLPILFLYLEQFGMAYSNEGILIDSSGEFRTFGFGTQENVGFFNIYSKLPDNMDVQLLAISIPTGRKINSDSLIEMRSIIDTIYEDEICKYPVKPVFPL